MSTLIFFKCTFGTLSIKSIMKSLHLLMGICFYPVIHPCVYHADGERKDRDREKRDRDKDRDREKRDRDKDKDRERRHRDKENGEVRSPPLINPHNLMNCILSS